MRRRTEETRNIILAAAKKLFLSSGYATTSVDTIAIEAKVTKRTIYGYFPDKRALFLGVIEEAVGDPWEYHIPPQAIATREGVYHALFAVSNGLNEIISQPDYVQLLRVTITEIPVQPDLSLLFSQGATRRSVKTLTNLFKTAHEIELFAIEDADAAARMFAGGFIVRVLLDGLLQPTSQVTKQSHQELTRYVELFMKGLEAGEKGM